jgi:hypothetical protein
MRTDKVLIVRLARDEYDALVAVAEAESREPPQQVAHLIRQDLAGRRAGARSGPLTATGSRASGSVAVTR